MRVLERKCNFIILKEGVDSRVKAICLIIIMLLTIILCRRHYNTENVVTLYIAIHSIISLLKALPPVCMKYTAQMRVKWQI